jgi:hypothetical protein
VGGTKVVITLPEYLAEWLNKIAREMARAPDDFISEILHRYYDIWRVGRDSCEANQARS